MQKRTTIRLEAHLLAEAKRLGMETGRSLTAVISDSLRQALVRPRGRRQRLPPLPVSRARGGVLPGVNLDNNGEVLDIMEGRR
jgi:hypothetical protein